MTYDRLFVTDVRTREGLKKEGERGDRYVSFEGERGECVCGGGVMASTEKGEQITLTDS